MSEVEIKDEYNLKLSKEKLGALIPILTDANDNIIDGFHREQIDPNWPKVKIEHISDPVQLSMARLASNVCRREVPAEEKTKLLANIAELSGWDAKEIAEAIGMSYRWVMKYLPDEFKEKPQLGREVAQRASYQESVKNEHLESPPEPAKAEDPVECMECGVRTWFPYKFKDKTLCSSCFTHHWRKGEVTQDLESKETESFESESLTPTVPVEKIDTGLVFTCPECGWKATHIHVNPSGKHKMQEVTIL